jgi:Cft2 family RNA processing exonuclease
MNPIVSRPALLGVVRPVYYQPENAPEGSHDARFRRDVVGLVEGVLQQHFHSDRVTACKQAYRQRISLEQLVASRITNLIMDMMASEYLYHRR